MWSFRVMLHMLALVGAAAFSIGGPRRRYATALSSYVDSLSSGQSSGPPGVSGYGQSSGAQSALIIQNKGGGHGELGYHLAKMLAQEQGMKVVILNDGSAVDKEPFRSYPDIAHLGGGVTVHWINPADPAAVDAVLGGARFDVVYDNYAKDVDSGRHVAELARRWNVKNYVFVSSAGMYTPGDEYPIVEKEPTKSTGQRSVEEYAAQIGLPWSSFRPQYIYGPKANKRDYLDWFFDRIVRGRPLPIPGSGQQITTLTDARDIAAMLAAVPKAGAAAHGQVFNCASGRVYTVDGIAQLAAKTVGVDPKSLNIVHYDPKALSSAPPKGAFPFRDSHFGVSAGKARRILNWDSAYPLEIGMREWYADYNARGRKDVDFSIDDAILREVV